MEGIFCEPASAASRAGVIKLCNENFFRLHTYVVCTLTGSGPKDPDIVFRVARQPLKIDAEAKAVEKVLGGTL